MRSFLFMIGGGALGDFIFYIKNGSSFGGEWSIVVAIVFFILAAFISKEKKVE